MTSFMENFTFKTAGIKPHRAPPINPAVNIRGIMMYDGSTEPHARPVHVPNAAPRRSWPSAPMFQNFARKARARPEPMRINGIAFVMVSLIP